MWDDFDSWWCTHVTPRVSRNHHSCFSAIWLKLCWCAVKPNKTCKHSHLKIPVHLHCDQYCDISATEQCQEFISLFMEKQNKLNQCFNFVKHLHCQVVPAAYPSPLLAHIPPGMFGLTIIWGQTLSDLLTVGFWFYKCLQAPEIINGASWGLPSSESYGGWFWTLHIVLLIATTQPISLTPFCLDASNNTTKRQTAHYCTVVLSFYLNEARQMAHCYAARCRPVAWLISQSFNLTWATMCYCDNTPHDNTPFGMHH
jgi:hypothetical protein